MLEERSEESAGQRQSTGFRGISSPAGSRWAAVFHGPIDSLAGRLYLSVPTGKQMQHLLPAVPSSMNLPV